MSSEAQSKACPSCGVASLGLRKIDTGMKLALVAGGAKNLPEQVCGNCYEKLTGQVSQGVRLRMEQENKEKSKMVLWSSRVSLVKKARALMTAKAFAEAAVAYEKYLRILELVYSVKKGELTPEVFNKSKRSKELTVVASVYWDLMRIYDTSPRFGDRMEKSAKKLAEFLPYSSIYAEIVRKLEGFLKSAKNPHVVKEFMRTMKVSRSRCFIATAVLPFPHCPEAIALREFRDHFLKTHRLGRAFVALYYTHSRKLIPILEKNCGLRKLVQVWVTFVGRVLLVIQRL